MILVQLRTSRISLAIKTIAYILLIPGTSSIAHLEENIGASKLILSDEVYNLLSSLNNS